MSGEVTRWKNLSPDTPIQIPTPEGIIELSVNSAMTVCVPPGTRPVDVLRFLLFCRENSLSPIMGDVCLVPRDGRHIVVVQKGGWVRKLLEHPLYEGHDAGVITKAPDGSIREVPGTCYSPDELLLGGWSRIYLMGQKPHYHSVQFQEYDTGKSTWKGIPRTMIRKVALCQNISECLLLYRGGYDRCEVPEEVDARIVEGAHEGFSHGSAVLDAQYEEVQDPNLSPDILAGLHEQIARLQATQEEVEAWCRSRKVDCLQHLSDIEGAELLRKLWGIPVGDEPFDASYKVVEEVPEAEEGSDAPIPLLTEPKPGMAIAFNRRELDARLRRKSLAARIKAQTWTDRLRRFDRMDQDNPSVEKLTDAQAFALESELDEMIRVAGDDPSNYVVPEAVRRAPTAVRKGKKKAETTA